MVRTILLGFCALMLFAAMPARAEPRTIFLNPDILASTGDPDHLGYVYDQFDLPYPVTWTPVEVPCRECGTLADAYNRTMRSLMNTRYWIEEIQNRQDHVDHEGRRNRPYADGEEPLDPDDEKISAARLAYDLGVDDMAARLPALQAQEESLKALGDDLRAQMHVCEAAMCTGSDIEPPVIIKDANAMGILPFDWRGPYDGTCAACAKNAAQLNELPTQARILLAGLEGAKAELMFAEMEILAIAAESNQILFDTPEGDLRTLQDKEKVQRDYERKTARHQRDMERAQEKAQSDIEKYEADLDAVTKNFEDALKLYNECSQTCAPPPETGMMDPDESMEWEEDVFLYAIPFGPF